MKLGPFYFTTILAGHVQREAEIIRDIHIKISTPPVPPP